MFEPPWTIQCMEGGGRPAVWQVRDVLVVRMAMMCVEGRVIEGRTVCVCVCV